MSWGNGHILRVLRYFKQGFINYGPWFRYDPLHVFKQTTTRTVFTFLNHWLGSIVWQRPYVVYKAYNSYYLAFYKTSVLPTNPPFFKNLLLFSRSVVFDLFDSMNCSMPNFSVLHYLLEFAQTHVAESMMPSNHLILCRHLSHLPSIFPSIRVFSNELALPIRWPDYWSFSFSISPSSEFSGFISFRMDWFDHLAVQGTLKSLLQHCSSKTSVLWPSAFFIV